MWPKIWACIRSFFTAGEKSIAVENLRLDQPEPDAINKVWAGDVTYIGINKRFRYLAAIMYLYSRRIVSCAFGNNRKGALTKRALTYAVRKRRPPEGMLFHSDRGVEYRCDEHTKTLDHYKIVHSANRPRCCHDNAHMESFFHTLKGELVRGRHFESEKELKQLVKGYIIHFYNKKRLHSALNYCSPDEFERLTS